MWASNKEDVDIVNSILELAEILVDFSTKKIGEIHDSGKFDFGSEASGDGHKQFISIVDNDSISNIYTKNLIDMIEKLNFTLEKIKNAETEISEDYKDLEEYRTGENIHRNMMSGSVYNIYESNGSNALGNFERGYDYNFDLKSKGEIEDKKIKDLNKVLKNITLYKQELNSNIQLA